MKTPLSTFVATLLVIAVLVFTYSQFLEIGRLKAALDKMEQSTAELARKISEIDSRTQMSVETIELARKNAKDIEKLRDVSKEAVNILGTMIGNLQTEFDKAKITTGRSSQ
jgi:pyruvate-formate lyase